MAADKIAEGPEEGMTPDAAEPSAADNQAEIDAGVEGETERERWLREQFEKEHQVMLALMRLLVSGINGEGRMMRAWRWLIDDFRSERRMLEGPGVRGSDENLVLGHVLSRFRILRNFGGSSESGRRG